MALTSMTIHYWPGNSGTRTSTCSNIFNTLCSQYIANVTPSDAHVQYIMQYVMHLQSVVQAHSRNSMQHLQARDTAAHASNSMQHMQATACKYQHAAHAKNSM